MGKQRKVKRYSSIYGKSRQRKRLIARVGLAVLAFVVIAGIVFLAALGISKLPKSEPAPTPSSPASEPSPESSQEESSEPEANTALVAQQVPASQITDLAQVTALAQQAKAQGATALVAPMKLADGVVLYNSTVPEVATWGAAAQAPVDAKAVADAIKSAGLTPIAQLYAFNDGTSPHARRDNSYYNGSSKTTTHLFDGDRWLNPYKESARKYICNLITELGTAGFEQVVLEDACFPDEELTARVGADDDGVSKDAILKQFYTEAAATGVPIVLAYDWAGIGGGGSASVQYGSDPATLGVSAIAPTIDLHNPPAGVSGSGAALVASAMQQVQAAAGTAQLLPAIAAGQESAVILQGLEQAGVDASIQLSAE